VDAKVPACLKNNSQKGYILKRITVVTIFALQFDECEMIDGEFE
jgi:hypothetical protein